MKRKVLALLIAVIMLVSFSSCSLNRIFSKPDKEFLNFLTGQEWCRLPDTRGDDDWDTMTFTQDSFFYYNCLCGEPVGDSDLYEKYSLDTENMKINLTGSKKTTVDILSYDDFYILLKYEGKILEFLTREMCEKAVPLYPEVGSYFTDYSACRTLVEYTDKGLTIAPPNYDIEFGTDEHLEALKVSEDVTFESVSVTETFSDDGNSTVDFNHKLLTEKQAKENISDAGSYGFLWYNGDLEVTKMVFYGVTQIY